MSASQPETPPVAAVREPIVDLERPEVYAALVGPKAVNWQTFPASSTSNSAVQITALQPGASCLVDRKVYLELDITAAFTGTTPSSATNLLQLGAGDGFRAFPISSVMTSANITLQNSSVTLGNGNQFMPQIVSRYHNWPEQRNADFSIAPAMPDSFAEYDTALGAINNPLSSYSGNDAEPARGAYNQLLTSLTNTPTTASFSCTLREALMISPFQWARGDSARAFAMIDTISTNFNFGAGLSRMWSHSNGAGTTLSTVTFNIVGARLLFRQLSPSDITHIPRSLTLPYMAGTLYPQESGSTVAAGASIALSSSTIQLGGVPHSLYISCSRTIGTQTYLTTDTFLYLSQLTITWNTETVFSSASASQLYAIAVKNGCNVSWPAWTSQVGSLLCIRPGSDFGLPPTQAPGSLGKHQIRVQATFTNLHGSTVTPALNVVAWQEGTFTIRDKSVYLSQNPLMPEDVLKAKSIPNVEYKETKDVFGSGIVEVRGGRFFRDTLSALKPVARAVLPVAEALVPMPYKPIVSGIRSLVGSGARGSSRGSNRRRARRMSGSGFASEQELSAREQERQQERADAREDARQEAREDAREDARQEARHDDDGSDSGSDRDEHDGKHEERGVRFADDSDGELRGGAMPAPAPAPAVRRRGGRQEARQDGHQDGAHDADTQALIDLLARRATVR